MRRGRMATRDDDGRRRRRLRRAAASSTVVVAVVVVAVVVIPLACGSARPRKTPRCYDHRVYPPSKSQQLRCLAHSLLLLSPVFYGYALSPCIGGTVGTHNNIIIVVCSQFSCTAHFSCISNFFSCFWSYM